MSCVAVIGGTGLDQLQGLEIVASHPVDTPFGSPSRPIEEGNLNGQRVFFLQRHGSPEAIPPHMINYRANIWSLKSLGVTDIVSINAVGGISPEMQPGRLIIPDQLVDYTWGREHTFDDGATGEMMHIDFTEPYDRKLRLALLAAAERAKIKYQESGTHAVTQGPRLETAAEVRRMAQDGCDIVGMTCMPEAALAREAGLAYANVCMVVNAAAGLDDQPLTLEFMRAILQREAQVVGELLREFLGSYSAS
ncbi:MAG: S-methyl-5'-thioinosine phosphorylase [Halioglobus sp.]